MDEMCSWVDPKDLQQVPEPIKSRIGSILHDYHNTVLSLQNDLSLTTFSYENSISELKKKLEEQSQRNLELQMENLKHRTIMNERARVELPAKKGFKHVAALKNKIRVLAQKNAELAKRENGLNCQIEFLIRNADKDSQELCQIMADQAMELNALRSRNVPQGHMANSVRSDQNLRAEIESLRANEKEYQNFIFEKSKEVHSLQSSINDLVVKNNILNQFRQKYDNLHSEYIRISTVLNEIKMRNTELNLNAGSNGIKEEILAEIEKLKEYQISTSNHLDRVFESITNPSNRKFKDLDILVSDIRQKLVTIKLELKTVNFTCERIGNYKTQLEKVFSRMHYTVGACGKELEEKDNLIEQFKATVHQSPANGPEDLSLENSLLKKENESLALQLKTIRPSAELIVENESMIKQNRLLISDIESLRDEVDKLSAANQLLANEINDLRNISPGEKDEALKGCYEDKISQLEDKIKQLSEQSHKRDASENEVYIQGLENQVDCYKQDVKTIESQFCEYKKAFDSFNIQEVQENIRDLRENIQKKDILISRLYSLVNKYRKLKEAQKNCGQQAL